MRLLQGKISQDRRIPTEKEEETKGEGVMNEPMPKTQPCKICGTKPKREIIGWSYGDSNDEFYLVHKCNGKSYRFPEKDTFMAWKVKEQERKVVEAWNRKQLIVEANP